MSYGGLIHTTSKTKSDVYVSTNTNTSHNLTKLLKFSECFLGFFLLDFGFCLSVWFMWPGSFLGMIRKRHIIHISWITSSLRQKCHWGNDNSFVNCVLISSPRYWLSMTLTLQWRHNECGGVLNHQPRILLLSRLFRRRSKKAPWHWPLWGKFTGDRWIPPTKGL